VYHWQQSQLPYCTVLCCVYQWSDIHSCYSVQYSTVCTTGNNHTYRTVQYCVVCTRDNRALWPKRNVKSILCAGLACYLWFWPTLLGMKLATRNTASLLTLLFQVCCVLLPPLMFFNMAQMCISSCLLKCALQTYLVYFHACISLHSCFTMCILLNLMYLHACISLHSCFTTCILLYLVYFHACISLHSCFTMCILLYLVNLHACISLHSCFTMCILLYHVFLALPCESSRMYFSSLLLYHVYLALPCESPRMYFSSLLLYHVYLALPYLHACIFLHSSFTMCILLYLVYLHACISLHSCFTMCILLYHVYLALPCVSSRMYFSSLSLYLVYLHACVSFHSRFHVLYPCAWFEHTTTACFLLLVCFIETILLFGRVFTVTQPFLLLFYIHTVFQKEADWPQLDVLLPRLIFCMVQGAQIVFGLYKLNNMGLLPVYPSDWISSMKVSTLLPLFLWWMVEDCYST